MKFQNSGGEFYKVQVPLATVPTAAGNLDTIISANYPGKLVDATISFTDALTAHDSNYATFGLANLNNSAQPCLPRPTRIRRRPRAVPLLRLTDVAVSRCTEQRPTLLFRRMTGFACALPVPALWATLSPRELPFSHSSGRRKPNRYVHMEARPMSLQTNFIL